MFIDFLWFKTYEFFSVLRYALFMKFEIWADLDQLGRLNT